MPDPVADLLRKTHAPESARAAAWDAFESSANEDELAEKLKAIKMPDSAKASLWDMKAAMQAPAAAAEQPAAAKPKPATATGHASIADQQWDAMIASTDADRQLGEAYLSHGPREVVAGVKDIAGGNVSRGAHRVITGGTVTAAPVLAPMAARAALQYPLRAGASLITGATGSELASSGVELAGGTPDQQALAADVGALVGGAVPSMLPSHRVRLPGPLRTTANPAEASAVAFGEAQGVPIDAGTRTGSAFVKNVQKRTGNSWGGANVAENAQEAQRGALTRVGGELSARANPNASTPITAGEGVQNSLNSGIRVYHEEATAAYERLRALSPDVTVDLRSTKQALKPIYERLIRESEIAPPQGGKARATQALDRLMRGPDAENLSVVDAALGDLKALARGADLPELRTQGQGLAAEAVKVLDARVQAAARRAGPKVFDALQEGRAATVAKYDLANVREMFGDEPRAVYNALTAKRDAGLARLREVQRVAPDEVPKVARAFLDDLMDTATAEGSFGHTDKLFSEWQKLGGATKAVLFPDAKHRADLDNFFLLAKRIGMNPNPSGTAGVMTGRLTIPEAIAALPSWAIARTLYNPESARWLTQGLTIAVRRAPTRQVRQSLLMRADRGSDLMALPAAAEQERRTPPPAETGSRR